MNKSLVLLAVFAAASVASAQSLYNNAVPAGLTQEGLRTGTRPAGGSYSEVQPLNTVAGFSVGNSAGTQFRLADDFAVTGPGWDVTGVSVFAYNTGATTTTITTGVAEIRSGSVTGAVVGTLNYTSTAFTDIYRIFNGSPGDTRRVQRVNFSYAGPSLAAGSYWLTYNLGNAANNLNPFNPSLTKVGARTTTGANAQQSNAGTWGALLDTGNPAGEPDLPQDIPFYVDGTAVPEPGTMMALGAGALVLLRRRKKA